MTAPARVAVNLRGVAHEDVRRGDALLTPEAWRRTTVVDVRSSAANLPSHMVVHVGAAAVPARLRKLAPDGAAADSVVRLVLDSPLPLQVGDRLLLRDPGRRQVVGGATVLDPAPPALRRRGAAGARAAALGTEDGVPDAGAELRRRRAVSRAFLRDDRRAGCRPLAARCHRRRVVAGDRGALGGLGSRAPRRHRPAVRPRCSIPVSLVPTWCDRCVSRTRSCSPPCCGACPELEETGGRVRKRGSAPALRPDLGVAVSRLIASLEVEPFAAPEQQQLASLGLGRRELGAAAAARAILLLPGDVALLPTAPRVAADRLRGLPQPFTLSAARQALGTTRRVAVPLLEHLDRIGHHRTGGWGPAQAARARRRAPRNGVPSVRAAGPPCSEDRAPTAWPASKIANRVHADPASNAAPRSARRQPVAAPEHRCPGRSADGERAAGLARAGRPFPACSVSALRPMLRSIRRSIASASTAPPTAIRRAGAASRDSGAAPSPVRRRRLPPTRRR